MAYPLGSVAKLPREPQNKTSDRQNGDLPRHKKQENHPRRLMHEAAPLLSLGDIATENQRTTVTRFKKMRSVAKISQVLLCDARTEHRHTGQMHQRTAGTVAVSSASVRAKQDKREQTHFSLR
jgi:3-mercaptopyruvate sulfurtransferase SseA